MKCRFCSTKMVELFTSAYCPHCEGEEAKAEVKDKELLEGEGKWFVRGKPHWLCKPATYIGNKD